MFVGMCVCMCVWMSDVFFLSDTTYGLLLFSLFRNTVVFGGSDFDEIPWYEMKKGIARMG